MICTELSASESMLQPITFLLRFPIVAACVLVVACKGVRITLEARRRKVEAPGEEAELEE